MEPGTILLIVLTIMTLFWLVAGWMRLRRYVLSLQLAEYDQKRYGQWYWQNRKERLYLGIGMVCLCLLLTAVLPLLLTDILFFFFVWIFILAVFLIPTQILILLTLVPAILSIVALAFAPRAREVKQPLVLTQRVLRLVVTAGAIEALPLLIALWVLDCYTCQTAQPLSREPILPYGFSYACSSGRSPICSRHWHPLLLTFSIGPLTEAKYDFYINDTII